MTNVTKRGKGSGKAPADSDKVLKILTEARQVVDDLGKDASAASPPAKKKPTTPAPKSPRSRSMTTPTKKPVTGKKPAAAKEATSPKKTSPSSAQTKKTVPAPKPAAKAPSLPLLSPRECGIQVLHSLPGRIRFRVKSLQYDDDMAREMEARLAAIKGIAEVGASPATGSLLISYHSKELVADPLGEALKTWFPELDTDSLLAELQT